jgi:RHS repeat-associated protein
MRSFAYQFNAVGMITQKVTTANGQLTTNIYCYDSLDRLISETILSASSTSMVNYAYDLAGNRTQMVNNGITVNYTYGQGNQLASWGTNGSQQFDAAGNVTNIHYEDGRQLSLTWDSRYRLAAAYTNGSLAEKYGYDALDRRIWISDGVETNYLIYEGIHCIAETDSSGSLLKSYTYGLGIDNILTMTIYGGTGSTPSVYYYLKDHLGSVQAIADSSGSIVESYCYDAWGNVFAFDSINQPITQSLIGNRILWQAREYSWKTRLYYFRARWYDSVTGRWLSNDPIGISGGVNQYVFCANNPVNMVDPTGLDALRGHGQGMTQNVTWSVISSAWPGSAGVVSSIQASTVAQGVNAALSDLGQPQPPGNIYPYQPDFAGVRNPGFTSGWPSSTSGHGPSWETGVVPGSQYAVKYYADPSRGQVIVLTPPTSSFYHYWQAFRFYFLNENVNQEMAVDFLVNRNYPYWEYNVFPNPYRDDNCK